MRRRAPDDGERRAESKRMRREGRQRVGGVKRGWRESVDERGRPKLGSRRINMEGFGGDRGQEREQKWLARLSAKGFPPSVRCLETKKWSRGQGAFLSQPASPAVRVCVFLSVCPSSSAAVRVPDGSARLARLAAAGVKASGKSNANGRGLAGATY
jgi:hypothetical protein